MKGCGAKCCERDADISGAYSVASVAAIAAEGLDTDQLSELALFLTALADTLALMAYQRGKCGKSSAVVID